MKVGLVLPQTASDGHGADWREIAELARQADAGGADSLWVCDHFLYRPADAPEVGYHEPFTLLAALAAVTRTVELGSIVLATSFRSPGLLAKMAATLDDIAGGRLILGLGCGWYEPEYRAFGYPFDHRVGRFEETLDIAVPLLRGERVTMAGRWSRVEDAVLLPTPSRTSIPIVIAAEGERMMRLAARHADGWQTAWYGRPDPDFERDRARLVDACLAEGRAVPEVLVGIEVRDPDGSDDPFLPLDVAAIADGLADWAAAGVAHVQLGVRPARPGTFAVALAALDRSRQRS